MSVYCVYPSELSPNKKNELEYSINSSNKIRFYNSGFLDFIQVIRPLSKQLQKWKKKTNSPQDLIDFFFLSLEGEDFKADIFKLFNLHNNFSKKNVLDEINDSLLILNELLDLSKKKNFGLGLVTSYLDDDSPLTSFIKGPLLQLICGNSVIVNSKPVCYPIVDYLIKLTLSFSDSIPICFVPSVDDDVLKLFIEHPAVKGVFYQGNFFELNKISDPSELLFKSHFLELEGRGSSVVHDVELDSFEWGKFIESNLMLSRRCRERNSRVFVQGSMFDEFIARYQVELKKYINEQCELYGVEGIRGFNLCISKKNSYEKAVDKLKKENCQLVTINVGSLALNLKIDNVENMQIKNENYASVVLGIDFSNCSILQQEYLDGPLITFTRYSSPPDAVKYLNTTELANSVSIWTNNEKWLSWFHNRLEFDSVGFNEVVNTYNSTKKTQFKKSIISSGGKIEEVFSLKNL